MKKNLTILCNEDSIEYQMDRQIQTTKNKRQNTSPFCKTSKQFNLIEKMTSYQTPQSQYPRHSFQFKSPKYAGIIEKNILQRLQIYDQKYKQKKQNQDISIRIRQQQLGIRQLRQKPEINELSKNIYEKIKKQRKLSPNVLQRFQTYECERLSRNAKYELLKTYGMQIKNSTFTYRKNINSKSRSPLKQTIDNQNKSRGKSKSQTGKSILKKTIWHCRNIGKIVSKKQKNVETTKKQQRFATQCGNISNFDSFQSMTPKRRQGYHKKNEQGQIYESQIYFKRNTPSQVIKQIIDHNASLSPIAQKKQNGKKWRVVS